MKRLVIDLATLPEEGKQLEGTLPAEVFGLGADAPSLRAANLMQLQHPMSVDLYVEQVIGRGLRRMSYEVDPEPDAITGEKLFRTDF